MHNNTTHLLVFTLDDQRYALHVASADRVFPVVEITPLPDAPEIVIGIVNIRGKVIPVVNIRKRFLLPEKETSLSDKLIITNTHRRAVGIIVDDVCDVIEYPESNIISSNNILSGINYIDGVAKLKDEMILIHDIDTFLSLLEENKLDDAVNKL